MKDARKSKPLVVLCFAVAAVVGVGEAVAQSHTDQSSGPLIAQRSRTGTSSSRRSSFDRRSAPTAQWGTGYDSRYGGNRYRDPRGGYSSSDSRSRYYGRSSRYQERYPSRGAGPAAVPPGRTMQPRQESLQKEPGTTSPGRATTARPGRTSRPGGIPPSGPGEAAVDVAKPTKPRTPAGAKPPGRGRAQAPRKQVKPQAQWPTFYLTLNADQIIVGDVFSVDVHLSNPKKAGFDRLAVVLAYDAVFLRPVKGPPKVEGEPPELATSMIDEATAAPLRRGAVAAGVTKQQPYIREAFSRGDHISLYENVIETEEGLVTYTFELENETATAQGRVASVYLEALQPTRRTFISFQFAGPSIQGLETAGELGTGLVRGDKDVLGLPLRPDDGTIDRGITILSERPSRERVRSLEHSDTSQEVYRTHLRLAPERHRIVVGEEFNVYVELNNPDHIHFDQVSLLIAYNPRVLKVIDYDAYNTITSGVNIHDGSYRNAFPFDFFLSNRVNLDTGLIDYRMRGYRRPLVSEGVLACVRFRGMESTSKTTLRVFVDYDGQDPTTGVFYRFRDVLADSADPTDGISTCSLQIGRLRSAAAEGYQEGKGGG